jgi:predicted small lipoprotein YifL
MKRLLGCIALLVLVAGLVACGPPKKSVFPPTITIQEMTVQPDGQWRVTVRIQNNSYGGMEFHSFDGLLKVADGTPVRLHARFDLDIPAFAADVTQVNLLPTPDMTAALKAAAVKGSAGSVPYSVDGAANAKPEQEKDVRDFSFHGTDALSPVPGIPNTWR